MDFKRFFTQRKTIPIYILLVGAISASTIFFIPSRAFGILPLPFEGNITHVEYNCLCSLSILITVTPTAATAGKSQPKQLLLVWGAQLLESILKKFGFKPPGGLPLIIPRTYLWCQVFYEGSQKLLGNYIPGAFPCYEFVGPPDYCRFKANAQGAIFNVGTSLF